MDIRDFEGLTKYKLIIPLIYVLSWLGMLFGPLFFPVIYQKICISFIVFLTLRIFYMFVIMVIVLYKSSKMFTLAKKLENNENYYQSVSRIGE